MAGSGRSADPRLVLLTCAAETAVEILPAIGRLPYEIEVVSTAELTSLSTGDPLVGAPDLVLLDARRHLPRVRTWCRAIRDSGSSCPLLLIATEDSLRALSRDWGFDGVVLAGAGAAEVHVRIRLATQTAAPRRAGRAIQVGAVRIDGPGCTVHVGDRPMELTATEFALLCFLARHPGQVFRREQLAEDVWGLRTYDGSRTVDAHVGHLRTKLGPQYKAMIDTVRGVGYRLQPTG